jgi:hypothetical protein
MIPSPNLSFLSRLGAGGVTPIRNESDDGVDSR